MPVDATDPEAREWLSRGDTSLATNRFDDAADALRLVDALYAAGAERVVVASENILDEGEEGWYCDALRVVLPADGAKRAALFDIVNREAEDEGYDPEFDAGQTTLFLWWD